MWAFGLGAGEPDGNLVRVLRRYAGKLPWSASMFQPAVSQAPGAASCAAGSPGARWGGTRQSR